MGDPCACFLVLPHPMGKTIVKLQPNLGIFPYSTDWSEVNI